MTPITVRDLMIGEGMPKIIVPLTGKMPADLMKQAQRIRKEPGVDAVEWRVDFYEHALWPSQVLAALKALRTALGDIPILFTCRTAKEGGDLEILKEDYYALNLAAAQSGLVDLVDVEMDVAEDVAEHIARLHELGVKVVASRHDFERTPEDTALRSGLERGWAIGGDISKLAVMPQSEEDVSRLLSVAKAVRDEFDRPFIAIAMGRLGTVSRTEGERYGSAMTFAALGQGSAPGQIPVDQLRRELERVHAEIS